MTKRPYYVIWSVINLAIAAAFGSAIAIAHIDHGTPLLILLGGAVLFGLFALIAFGCALQRNPNKADGVSNFFDVVLNLIFR